MKLSFASAALILTLFASAGWLQQNAVKRLQNEQRVLVAEAVRLGLDPSNKHPGASHHRTAIHSRIHREAEAKSFAGDLIQFVQQIDEVLSHDPEKVAMKKISAILERMHRLDGGQTRIVVNALRKSSEIDDDIRGEVIGYTIMCLSEKHPEAAMVIFTEAGELKSSDQVIEQVLGNWAEMNPLAALNWVRKNGAQFPEWVTDDTNLALVSGCAHTDPKLAFQWITELELKDISSATSNIVRTARTPEAQSAMFSYLHEFTKTPTADRDALAPFLHLAAGMAEQGYNATHAWLAAANPNQEECEALALGLSGLKTQADSGKWLEWMGANLPPDKLQERVLPLMDNWTKLDFRAAGEWLSTTADGAVKRVAVASYAKTVAPYEPAIAAQWAETLPADRAREDLLRQIHSDWTKLDAAAASVFAKKHDILP